MLSVMKNKKFFDNSNTCYQCEKFNHIACVFSGNLYYRKCLK